RPNTAQPDSLSRGKQDKGCGQDRDSEADVAENHPGERHPVALLAGLAYLAARDVTAYDRGDRAEEQEDDLPDPECERYAGELVGRRCDRDRIGRRLVWDRRAKVPSQRG